MAPPAFADLVPEIAHARLQRAYKDLSERGLYVAARWSVHFSVSQLFFSWLKRRVVRAAELLTSIPLTKPPRESTSAAPYRTSTPNKARSSLLGLADVSIPHAHPASSPIVADDEPSFDVYPDSQRRQATSEEDALELAEADVLMLGKAYFDTKEFERAAAALRTCRSAKGIFLRLYSRFLFGERQAQEQSQTIMGELSATFSLILVCRSELTISKAQRTSRG
jgi:anaphase-promoting complex subunit 8